MSSQSEQESFGLDRGGSGHQGNIHYFDPLFTTLVWDKKLMCPRMPPVLFAEISIIPPYPASLTQARHSSNILLYKSKQDYATHNKMISLETPNDYL